MKNDHEAILKKLQSEEEKLHKAIRDLQDEYQEEKALLKQLKLEKNEAHNQNRRYSLQSPFSENHDEEEDFSRQELEEKYANLERKYEKAKQKLLKLKTQIEGAKDKRDAKYKDTEMAESEQQTTADGNPFSLSEDEIRKPKTSPGNY